MGTQYPGHAPGRTTPAVAMPLVLAIGIGVVAILSVIVVLISGDYE